MREAAEGIMKLEAAGLKDQLYRNDGGIFKEVSVAAGIVERGHGLSAAWWDYDDDGDPDLYVANDFNDPDHLYRNDGPGSAPGKPRFVDVSGELAGNAMQGFGMGASWGDFDRDGKLDLYEFCQQQLVDSGEETLRPAPLLRGADLIAEGYAPGPRFKAMLAAVEDAQLEGQLSDRDAALLFLRENFSPALA